jgi:hypothetical protein
MGTYILVVPSRPVAGLDQEYNRWYDEQHLADICAIPGVKSGRRFQIDAASPNKPDTDYLAIYEIETDDPAGIFAEVRRRALSGELRVLPVIDIASAKPMLYKVR